MPILTFNISVPYHLWCMFDDGLTAVWVGGGQTRIYLGILRKQIRLKN